MAYKIGNLKLKNRFFLAPMLEPNDIAFRLLCKGAGCGLTYTGMISPLTKQKIDLDDNPAMQIFCNSTQGVRYFMERYDNKVTLWDLNLGCPSKLSRKLEHGAFMHNDIEEIEEILKVMKDSTEKPITIKLRKSENAIEIAKMSEKYVDAIGIHPRTIEQGYSGNPDYDFALKLKNSVKVPVIYSGNVNLKNTERILEDFDFVFIGREAIGDPNIFYRLNGLEPKIRFDNYLNLAKKYNLFFRQIKFQAMNFTKHYRGARKMRADLISTRNVDDIINIYKQINKL